jgi:hypothetical protein
MAEIIFLLLNVKFKKTSQFLKCRFGIKEIKEMRFHFNYAANDILLFPKRALPSCVQNSNIKGKTILC